MARRVANVMYVLARGASGRPVCQHKLDPGVQSVTACGVDLTPWSLEYTPHRFESILCRRSRCRA